MKVILTVSSILLSILLTSDGFSQGNRSGRMIRGSFCEYIRVNSITANDGCTDGSKFVIKRNDEENTRKQFLILEGEAIIAFVKKGVRFSECTSYKDITGDVDCQQLSDLQNFDLSSATI